MSSAPIVILITATLSIVFTSALYGTELAERSQVFQSLTISPCVNDQSGNFFSDITHAVGWIGCNLLAFLETIANLFILLGNVIAFFFNALTFNIPGAPTYVRLVVSVIAIGGVGWAIASLFRGTKA